MTISEYLLLRDKKFKTFNTGKRREIVQRLKQEELNNPLAAEYERLRKQLSKQRQTKTALERYGKDCTQVDSLILKTEDRINEIESEAQYTPCLKQQNQHESQKRQNKIVNDTPLIVKQQQPTIEKEVTQSKNLNYYIINLAWAKDIPDMLLTVVREFLNKSNFISFDDRTALMRQEHLLQWKFAYDTVEEMAHAKSLYVCASHLLSVLNKNNETQIELFCKIQNY